eukprot:s3242_g2.t1
MVPTAQNSLRCAQSRSHFFIGVVVDALTMVVFVCNSGQDFESVRVATVLFSTNMAAFSSLSLLFLVGFLIDKMPRKPSICQ